MKRSNRVVILVGVLLAILAFVAIVILLNSRQGEVAEQAPTTATVLVAIDEIAPNTDVTADLVGELEVDLDAVQPDALRDTSQLADRTTVTAIPAGSQVTEAAFGGGTALGADLEGQLLPGEKAIAVQLDPVTGLNFLLEQGDVVDLIVSIDFAPGHILGAPHLRSNDSEIVRTVKAVLQAKRVLYASDSNIPLPPSVDEDGNVVPPTETEVPGNAIIIIAGSDADAELLKFAQRDSSEVGTITVTLRSSDDEAIEETVGITLQDVIDTYGLVIPQPIEGIISTEEATE